MGLQSHIASGDMPEMSQPKSITNSIGMKLARIPAGKFAMGSHVSAEELARLCERDADFFKDQLPLHRVRITKPFYMGVYEVTLREHERVTGIIPVYYTKYGPGKNKIAHLDADRIPAHGVSWLLAVEFCRRLSALPAERRAGRRYRLPTEAEWEYACRAGSDSHFAFGDDLDSRKANFCGDAPFASKPKKPVVKGPYIGRPTVVGTYKSNAFGLYDMHGNVWEFCSDWYSRDFYKKSPTDNPQGPQKGTVRVVRGGCWYADGEFCRSAARSWKNPTSGAPPNGKGANNGNDYVGFRVVAES